MTPPASGPEVDLAGCLHAGTSSFARFLAGHAPELLPPLLRPTPGGIAALGDATPLRPVGGSPTGPAHATTIVALVHADGAVMAGDRRATAGSLIAHRAIEKVYVADGFTLVGIAGVAGLATELVALFQVELEHYEKIEGACLTLEGRANRLRTMIRTHLPWALQGLPIVPLLAGYDPAAGRGRIFSYDVAGGCYEENDHAGVGSGAPFARGALKKLWRPDLTADAALRVALEALYDAADDDTGTAGPDVARRIWPTCAVVDASGARLVEDADLARLVEELVADRRGNPGGAR